MDRGNMKFCSSSLLLFIIAAFLFRGGSLTTTSELRCYRCISMKCNTSPEICSLGKAFVQREVEKHYYTDGYPLPDCPSSLDDWEDFAKEMPSKLPCQESVKGQATCVLGRFQMNSLVVDTNINLTTFGTVLGCAKKQLLDSIKATTLGKDKKVMSTLHTQARCHLVHGESQVRDSLQHFLQLEHCSKITDMCYMNSYCIHPHFVDIRTFKQNSYASEHTGINMITILIWVAVIIGIVVLIMTLAGIKYA